MRKKVRMTASQRELERERESETETETQREKHREREKEREREREKEREKQRYWERERERERERQTDRQTDKQTDRDSDRHIQGFTNTSHTWTDRSEDDLVEVGQLIEVLDGKAVLASRRGSDAVQLTGVRQTNADGVYVDAFLVRSHWLRDGSATVDVGHTICTNSKH